MTRREFLKCAGPVTAMGICGFGASSVGKKPPNIVIIYADDLGYGDLSCYGARKVKTTNIDKLASEGLRFVNAHSPSATCTPSRYSMLTGEYAWRRKGTGIAAGDARMIIEPGRTTLASILQERGYKTGVVGKWHLGLGDGNVDWNAVISPGPEDIGFDYSFLIPATGDRVPCVYVENGEVAGLEANDPIKVSYKHKVGDEPTGRENPEFLKMKPSHGHDNTIINGISRIGWMSGGKKARWVDEDIADVITGKAVDFIERHKGQRFFLYFSTHDIHVPRVPHPRFAGKSGLGPRGDAILQLDWSVGQIMKALVESNVADDTLLIFTSDNGPVLDDGYRDEAVEKAGGHKPAGPLRGGKYSAFDAGTRVPFIVRWPGRVKHGVSDALVCQIDFMSSFANLTGRKLTKGDAPDSFDILDALLGESNRARGHLVEHSLSGTLSIIVGDWKYIEPSNKSKIAGQTGIETGNNPKPQLYNLRADLGERKNVSDEHPDIVERLQKKLEFIKAKGRSSI